MAKALIQKADVTTPSGKIRVTAKSDGVPIAGAPVTITPCEGGKPETTGVTDGSGRFEMKVPFGVYHVRVQALDDSPFEEEITVDKREMVQVTARFRQNVILRRQKQKDERREVPEGTELLFEADPCDSVRYDYRWSVTSGFLRPAAEPTEPESRDRLNTPRIVWDTTGVRAGTQRISVNVTRRDTGVDPEAAEEVTIVPRPLAHGDILPVALRRTAVEATMDLPLWVAVRRSTDAIAFNNYKRFIDFVLCGETANPEQESEFRVGEGKVEARRLGKKRYLPFTDTDSYRLLKVATEAFLIVNCGTTLDAFEFSRPELFEAVRRTGIRPAELDMFWSDYLEFINGSTDKTIPYLYLVQDKVRDGRLREALPPIDDEELAMQCSGVLRAKLTNPCLLELIWSYWHEEGMLVQTLNAISRRFQNIRGPADIDPLANLEIDPLRPLNQLLWGYLQDEQHRLSVVRRTYEYDHHYGFRLYGKAIPEFRPADSRSKFLEAFHSLLHLCSIFFTQDDDTTVIADAFPVLNALKDVHLLLSEGAHNQFGDLPSTARVEMLMQEWLLYRPEFREFLPTRVMVAYPEGWMDRVDAMKKLQGWTDTSVLHFRNLGVFGEQILLSVRFGNWNDIHDPDQAANWARYWRAEIQGYIHAYRAVTGADVTSEPVDTVLPAVHLQRRLATQRPGAPLLERPKGAALLAPGKSPNTIGRNR